MHPTEQKVLRIIVDHPGVRAVDIARQLGVTKGRVSQIIAELRASDAVLRDRPPAGRGYALRPAADTLKRRMIRGTWTCQSLI